MAEEEGVQETVEQEAPPEAPPVEEKARDMGWVPQDEFRGDPDNWRPADEFVKRGEEFLPFIKRDRDKFRQEADGLKAELAKVKTETETKFERLERMSRVALDEQKRLLEAQYATLKDAAVLEGDTEAVRAIDRQQREAIDDLETRAAPPAQEPSSQQPDIPPEVRATLDTWRESNRWFETDPEMRAVASVHHERLMSEKPGLTLEENLAATRDYVRSKYPEKFSTTVGNGAAPKGSPVESGSRGGGGTSARGLWGKLDKDVRELAERQIESGQFAMDAKGNKIEDMAKRRERYAELYFGDEAP